MDRIPLEVYHLIVRQIYDDPTFSQKTTEARCYKTLPTDGADRGSDTLDEGASTEDEGPSTEDDGPSTENDGPSTEDEAASPSKIDDVRNSFEALKSLRLCSKRLACVTAEFLFEKIYVHFTEESYDRLEAISQHPVYRHYVKRLCIIPKAIRGSLLQRDEFELWLQSKREPRAYIWWTRARDDYAGQVLSMPDSIELTPAVIDFHYGRYRSLYTKQENLVPKVEGILQGAIGCFTRLARVECVRKWHQWNLNCNYHRNCRNNDKADTADNEIDRLWKVSARPRTLDMNQSMTILRAVARGRHISGAQFDAGPLFGEVDTSAMEAEDSRERREIHGLMADAKDLIVRFRSNDVNAVRRLIPSGTFASLLGLATEAVSLTCDFNGIFRTFELVPLACFFGNVTWSRLTSLSLLYFSVESRELTGLLSRHKSHLQHLTLSDGWLRGGSWYDVFSSLREGALKKVAVRRLSDVSQYELSSDDLRNSAHGTVDDMLLPSTHPLSEYLFDGAIWSPKIPAALRQQHVFLRCDNV